MSASYPCRVGSTAFARTQIRLNQLLLRRISTGHAYATPTSSAEEAAERPPAIHAQGGFKINVTAPGNETQPTSDSKISDGSPASHHGRQPWQDFQDIIAELSEEVVASQETLRSSSRGRVIQQNKTADPSRRRHQNAYNQTTSAEWQANRRPNNAWDHERHQSTAKSFRKIQPARASLDHVKDLGQARGAKARHKGNSRRALTGEEAVRVENMKTRHILWRYSRHQYSKEELPAVKQAFTFWRQNFEQIDTEVKLTRGIDAKEEDGKWLYEHNKLSTMREMWEALDIATRREKWPLLMLSTLRFCPKKCNKVLSATLNPLPPGYAIHDVLSFFAKNLKLDQAKSVGEREARADSFVDLVAKTLEDMPSGYVPFGQKTFGLLARKLPAAHSKELLEILRRSDLHLSANTLCQFASTLAADASCKQIAFDILKGLATDGANLNEPKYASVVTKLLLNHAQSDGSSHNEQGAPAPSSQAMLETLMARGLSPNVMNLTAFLNSLCERGDLDEAVRLALLFAETGIELDAKVFVTIFRSAKASLRVEKVLEAIDVAKVSQTPYEDVLNNALHAVFYFASMESRDKSHTGPFVLPAFGPMLRIYAKRFDLEALQRWIPEDLSQFMKPGVDFVGEPSVELQQRHWAFRDSIVPVVRDFFSESGRPYLQPDLTTVVIMLRAYIKSMTERSKLLSFYHFFTSCLEQEREATGSEPDIISKHGSLIHDTLIIAITEQPHLTTHALKILDDMLKDTAARTSRTRARDADATIPSSMSTNTTQRLPVHPAPSVFTFSIILHELYRRSDVALAKQILGAMRQYKVAPNLTTWNTVLRGHAYMQNPVMTVRALRDLETDGFTPNSSTFKAFGRLKDQGKALELIERIIESNKEKLGRMQMDA